MEPVHHIRLRPGQERKLLAGHLWIYRNEVEGWPKSVEPGDLGDIEDSRGHFVGRAYLNPRSMIFARVLTRERVPVDQAFFLARLNEARGWREQLFGSRLFLPESACRIVHSEGDALPGLIVDRYGDALVLQILTAGMERRRELIVDAVDKIFQPRLIVLRNDSPMREREGLTRERSVVQGKGSLSHGTRGCLGSLGAGRVKCETSGWAGAEGQRSLSRQTPGWAGAEGQRSLSGQTPGWEGAMAALPAESMVTINGLKVVVDLWEGQKTGLFLDQADNYRLLEPLSRGARVLDCFCYLGLWGLHAARYGARQVLGIDQSRHAIERATALAKQNGLPICTFQAANVFDDLKERDRRRETFDLIILDPPAFVKSRAQLAEAIRGYKEINLRSMRLLRPGGYLITCSCSHHLNAARFREILWEAAADVRRSVRLLAQKGQNADHPVILGMPETEYLTCFLLQVI